MVRRWSVRDLASTLYSCSFPIDFSDEEHEADHKFMCTSSGTMIFNQKGDGRIHRSMERTSKNRLKNSAESNWPSFNNEDYIVFCFKDDGGIDLELPVSSPKVDRMEPRHITPKGEEEKESIHPYPELPPDDDEDDIKDITEVEETMEPKPVPAAARLSDSTNSDSSSSSFAFPVMNWEWKGSPARMPKLEERSKTRKTGARIPCWRF